MVVGASQSFQFFSFQFFNHLNPDPLPRLSPRPTIIGHPPPPTHTHTHTHLFKGGRTFQKLSHLGGDNPEKGRGLI